MPEAKIRTGSGPVVSETWETVGLQSKAFLRWQVKGKKGHNQKRLADMEILDDGVVRAMFSLSDWVELEFEDKWKGKQLVDEFRSNRKGGRRSSGPDSHQTPQEQQEQTSPQQSRENRSGVPSTASSRASLAEPAKKPKKRRINDDFGTLGSSSTLPTVGAYAPHASLRSWEPKASTSSTSASKASAGPVLPGTGSGGSGGSGGGSGLYRAPSASADRSVRNSLSASGYETMQRQQQARQEADREADGVVDFDSPPEGTAAAKGGRAAGTESLQTPPTSKRPFDRISESHSSEEDPDSKRRSHLDSFVVPNSGTPEKSSYRPTPGGQAPRAPAKRPGGGLINLGHNGGPGGDQSYSLTSSPGLRPRDLSGLQNLGNTCYMNAVLQAFASQREFVEELLLMRSKFQGCQDGPIFTYSAELLEKLSKLENRAGPLNPGKLRERIVANCPIFKGFKQQDAHEFLLEYSNQLHDELVAARRETLANQGLDLEKLPQGFALATETYLDSQVEKVLVCSTCGASHSLHEQFRDFSLDFTASGGGASGGRGNVCRLTDMLRSYFSPEAVEAQCERCKTSNAKMGKRLTHAPRTLILHMKRFVPNLAQQRYDKQHQRVEFPDLLDLRKVLASDAVDLKANPATAAAAAAAETRDGLLNVARPFLRREASDPGSLTGQSASSSSGLPPPPLPPPPDSPPSNAEDAIAEPVEPEQPSNRQDRLPLNYRLRSVVTHNGPSPHSGHYVCYGRGADAKWRLFDDSTVRELPPDFNLDRLGSEAYILFYTLDSR